MYARKFQITSETIRILGTWSSTCEQIPKNSCIRIVGLLRKANSVSRLFLMIYSWENNI